MYVLKPTKVDLGLSADEFVSELETFQKTRYRRTSEKIPVGIKNTKLFFFNCSNTPRRNDKTSAHYEPDFQFTEADISLPAFGSSLITLTAQNRY